jgi:death on curing protein
MELVYPTMEQAIASHRMTVEISGGGSFGHLELGKLESVLEHIQNDDYYPTFDEKLTHLFFCACKFHCFEDGNKRIAIVLSSLMLLLNGYLIRSTVFLRQAENISYHVAAGNISKELLKDWISAVLKGQEEDESLKLRIFNAIDNGDQAAQDQK